MLETIENEGVSCEACSLSQDGQGVYHFMEVADLEQACETFEKSRFPIDGEHTAKLDATFDERVELGMMFGFTNRGAGEK